MKCKFFCQHFKILIIVEGCEYRVSEEVILSWLSLYGEVVSEMVEDLFLDNLDGERVDDGENVSDSGADGTNRTGNYSVVMRLESNIPQLLPMGGRRVKIYYRGIRRLCTNCFQKHNKKGCHQEKVPSIDYVANFWSQNDDIPDEFIGRWIEILENP